MEVSCIVLLRYSENDASCYGFSLLSPRHHVHFYILEARLIWHNLPDALRYIFVAFQKSLSETCLTVGCKTWRPVSFFLSLPRPSPPRWVSAVCTVASHRCFALAAKPSTDTGYKYTHQSDALWLVWGKTWQWWKRRDKNSLGLGGGEEEEVGLFILFLQNNGNADEGHAEIIASWSLCRKKCGDNYSRGTHTHTHLLCLFCKHFRHKTSTKKKQVFPWWCFGCG